MKEQNKYLITGYIPSDEPIPVVNIYKLVKLGIKNPKWLFISISDTGGYGTATEWDNWSNSEAECIIDIINLGSLYDTNHKIIIGTLDEAIEKAESIRILLEAKIIKDE